MYYNVPTPQKLANKEYLESAEGVQINVEGKFE